MEAWVLWDVLDREAVNHKCTLPLRSNNDGRTSNLGKCFVRRYVKPPISAPTTGLLEACVCDDRGGGGRC